MRWLALSLLVLAMLLFMGAQWQADVGFYKEVRYFIDSENHYQIEDVIHKDWSENAISPINFGFSDHRHWFYLVIPDDYLYSKQKVAIEVDFPTIEKLALYVIDEAGNINAQYQTGAGAPFDSRHIWDEDFVFIVDPEQEGTTIFIEAQTQNALQVPIRMYSEEDFYKKDEWNLLVWGGYYGIMIIMAVYNLLNGIIMKERLFFYYCLYVLSTALIMSALNGHGFAYLWQGYPQTNHISIAVFTCLATASGTAFALNFLRVRRFHRIYTILGRFVLLASLGVIVLSVITLRDYSYLATAVAMLFAIVMFAFGVKSVRESYFLGWYFLAGWAVFLLSIAAFSLNIFGILPSNSITSHSKEVGSVFEIIMFSLGMSAIYNHEKEERDRIHRALSMMKDRLKKRVNVVNNKSGVLEIPSLESHIQDIRDLDRRIHMEQGRVLVISVLVMDKATRRPDDIALGDCLKVLFNSRITVFPFKARYPGFTGDITVLLFPLHNKFEAEGVIERVENWKFSLGENYDLHFGYAISHLTEKYDVDYIEESFHYLDEAIQKQSTSYSIDDTLSYIHRNRTAH